MRLTDWQHQACQMSSVHSPVQSPAFTMTHILVVYLVDLWLGRHSHFMVSSKDFNQPQIHTVPPIVSHNHDVMIITINTVDLTIIIQW